MTSRTSCQASDLDRCVLTNTHTEHTPTHLHTYTHREVPVPVEKIIWKEVEVPGQRPRLAPLALAAGPSRRQICTLQEHVVV